MSTELQASSLSVAFRAVFDAELPYVIRSLRRLGVADRDVEDLAQEVFLAVHRRFETCDRSRPMRPWLLAFVYRVAANHRRSTSQRTVLNQPAPPDPSPSPEARTASEDLVLRALAVLPFERRSVVVMHDVDGWSAPEIATLLEIPVNTVYSRLRVGRAELEEVFVRLGGAR